MTNNLKAERTLTAEELQAIIDGCEKATPGPWFEGDKWVFVSPRSGEPTHALENIFRDVPEAQENCLHVSRLDPDTVKAMASMALQTLSTQQPMGKVTTRFQMLMDAYVRGYAWSLENPDSQAFVHKAAYDYADKTTSALHPNQESGE